MRVKLQNVDTINRAPAVSRRFSFWSPLRRFAPALPQGEPSARPWTEVNFVVRQTKQPLSLCGYSKRSRFPLKAPSGGAPAGRRGYIYGRRAGFDNNNAGASLTADPRRGTLSFVTQKFFCFGAINNRRNNWCFIPLCRHSKGWCQTGKCL